MLYYFINLFRLAKIQNIICNILVLISSFIYTRTLDFNKMLHSIFIKSITLNKSILVYKLNN